VAVLAALNGRLYVKVLIHIYIWQHCQDRQTLSLAALPSIWRTLPCGSADFTLRLGSPWNPESQRMSLDRWGETSHAE
jgi:hypothetical protein